MELCQSASQAQPFRKCLRKTIQLDSHLTRFGSARVASQPCLPTQPRVCSLRPGEDRGCRRWVYGSTLLHLHLYTLGMKEVHARTTMEPPTPVTPEKRGLSNGEWMQE